MNRTFTAFTAIIFATALAYPAFAQMGAAGDVSSAASSSSSESTRHEYQAAPAPMTNSLETSKREFHSESSESNSDPSGPSAQTQRDVQNKVTTRTTTSEAPPSAATEETTTRHTETEKTENSMR